MWPIFWLSYPTLEVTWQRETPADCWLANQGGMESFRPRHQVALLTHWNLHYQLPQYHPDYQPRSIIVGSYTWPNLILCAELVDLFDLAKKVVVFLNHKHHSDFQTLIHFLSGVSSFKRQFITSKTFQKKETIIWRNGEYQISGVSKF